MRRGRRGLFAVVVATVAVVALAAGTTMVGSALRARPATAEAEPGAAEPGVGPADEVGVAG